MNGPKPISAKEKAFWSGFRCGEEISSRKFVQCEQKLIWWRLKKQVIKKEIKKKILKKTQLLGNVSKCWQIKINKQSLGFIKKKNLWRDFRIIKSGARDIEK